MEVEDFLAHYGVPGMKWGKVKTPQFVQPNGGGTVAAPQQTNGGGASFVKNAFQPRAGQVEAPAGAPKGDVEWAKNKANVVNLQKVANQSHQEFQDKFRQMLNDPKFADVRNQILNRRDNPAAAKDPKVVAFFRQAKKAHDAIWEKHSQQVFGKAPSGKLHLVAVRHPDGSITSKLVKQSADSHIVKPKGKLTRAMNSSGADPKVIKPGKGKSVHPPKGRPLTHGDISHATAREFNESMVKRDGLGQFAKKASNLDPRDVEWLKEHNLKDLELNILIAASKDVQAAVKAVTEKYGIPESEIDKNPTALAEGLTSVVQALNKASEHLGVSPSGTYKLRYSLNKAKDDIYALPMGPNGPIARKVAAKAPPKRLHTLSADSRRTPLAKPPMFNPNADISAGKVRDVVPAPPAYGDWYNNAYHSEIMEQVDDFLVHHGVKEGLIRHDGLAPTTAAIVVVPSDLDPIRLVGDESKHATLLHFGETATLPSDAKSVLLDLVAQAAQLTMPFTERICEVSRLGPKTPPALVAMLSDRYLGQIRNALQVTPQVREYLQNSQQHPQFTPHVTLGYPDYAREEALRALMISLYRVQFDRISLWWNGEHYDVPFMDPQDAKVAENDGVNEAGWSDNLVSNFLAHFGIKGMRWGIRRPRGADGTVGNDAGIGKKMGVTIDHPTETHGGGSSAHPEHDLLLRARNEGPTKLSTQELRTANERAMQLQAYNRMFDPAAKGHAELQRKVEALRLQKEFSTLRAQMKPPSNLDRVLNRAKSGWGAYRQLDKLSGGALSKKVGMQLGLIKESEAEVLKRTNTLLKARKTKVVTQHELEELQKKYPHLFT